MFRDIRFGNGGRWLTNIKPPQTIYLSNERHLFLRIMSPQENGENWDKFAEKILKVSKSGRWNFVCAMQTDPPNNMPNLILSIERFLNVFNPERVRVYFLSPVHGGDMLPSDIFNVTIPSLLRLDDRIECCTIDANYNNGLFLADFFDFT